MHANGSWSVFDHNAILQDRFVIDRYLPPVDESQDWFLVSGEEENGYTILEFTRKLITCDDKDLDIKVCIVFVATWYMAIYSTKLLLIRIGWYCKNHLGLSFSRPCAESGWPQQLRAQEDGLHQSQSSWWKYWRHWNWRGWTLYYSQWGCKLTLHTCKGMHADTSWKGLITVVLFCDCY